MRGWIGLGMVLALAGCMPPQPTAQQRNVVFFTEWSALLDGPATGAITAAAKWATAHPDQMVTVTGFADPTGSAAANRALSTVRAQVVTDLLMKDGVPAAHIQQRSIGSVGYIETSQESRRVEIVVGAP